MDAPLSLVRRSGGSDRAAILEKAWERGDPSATLASGLYALTKRDWQGKTPGHVPLLLLNGTRVQDGCRFETSVAVTAVGAGVASSHSQGKSDPLVRDCLSLRLFELPATAPNGKSLYSGPRERAAWTLGATTDLAPNLCRGDDVRLSTAALLSARFPLISPSGHFEQCGGGSSVNVVDGGYFETSASATIGELWDSLRGAVRRYNQSPKTTKCIVPVFIQIDNHYHGAPGPGEASRPLESLVPVLTLSGSRNAREAEARQAAALDFGQASFDGWTALAPLRNRHGALKQRLVDRFAHVYPRSHPGNASSARVDTFGRGPTGS